MHNVIATIQVFTILNHLCDNNRIFLVDSTEEFGRCLNVCGSIPLTFINGVETSGDALSTRAFFNKSIDEYRQNDSM